MRIQQEFAVPIPGEAAFAAPITSGAAYAAPISDEKAALTSVAANIRSSGIQNAVLLDEAALKEAGVSTEVLRALAPYDATLLHNPNNEAFCQHVGFCLCSDDFYRDVEAILSRFFFQVLGRYGQTGQTGQTVRVVFQVTKPDERWWNHRAR